MEPGNIVEFIDREKIICAAVLDVKEQRFRAVTETGREVKLSGGRIFHKGGYKIDTSMSRDSIVNSLKKAAEKRTLLKDKVDIEEIWSVFNTEQQWIDLNTMVDLCFPGKADADHESAVLRAFFENRIYFKFNNNSFFPNKQQHVDQIRAKEKEEKRNSTIIDTCASLIRALISKDQTITSSSQTNPRIREKLLKFAGILKSVYLMGQDSPYIKIGKGIMEKTSIYDTEGFLPILIKTGVFDTDENIDLIRYDIPLDFPDSKDFKPSKVKIAEDDLYLREDLTHLNAITIDGSLTLDYDDAITIEECGDNLLVGVHIVDVGYFIRKGDPIDIEAQKRASSIYMPDLKISMLPSYLSEEACSLKQGKIRPAISTMVKITKYGDIIGKKIIPSVIKVCRQMTYADVNQKTESDTDIINLYRFAQQFREKRLDNGAIELSLPEIYIRIEDEGSISLSKVDRESKSRVIVSELMIMANWIMAGFLAEKGIPAVFRSQPGPKERLFKGTGETIFQNIMQRKQLSRFVLGTDPERHCGLGLDAYTTATSPIRKYFDLITQRQIRAALGLEALYTKEEIKPLIVSLEESANKVSMIQRNRNRYWILKYLEQKRGAKQEAIILYKKRNSYAALMPEYMIESDLPLSANLDPGAFVRVTIQHVDARRDKLSIYMG